MKHLISNRRTMVVALGTAILAVAAGEPAFSAQAQKKLAEPQNVSNQQLVQAIHILQSVKKTLEAADHDYGGHRVNAVRDIGKAEKQLREALHAHHKQHASGKNPGASTGKTGGGKGHPEPQKLSNAELASAIPALENTIALLGKADHDYGGHRAQAVTDLKAAVAQLGTALKFAQVHDQKKP